MITQIEAEKYYKNMYDIGSIYVWGFNSGTIISKETIDKAYKSYGSANYNRTYYDNKLKEGNGKNGSDCSGAHYGISGYDTTAQGYYKRCTKTGSIASLPKDKLCLLFSGSSTSNITHTGVWLPKLGKVFHMKSSKDNAVIENVETSKFKNGWWGYADFISDYDTEVIYKDEWVKDLQNVLNYSYNANLTVDGEFGPKTLNSLPTIKKGEKGSIVTMLQTRLNSLGYNVGKVDGVFGKGTLAGVVAFQKAYSLSADGIVGKNTWNTLGNQTP